MAIALRNESHSIGNITGPFAASEPTGTTQNDVLVALFLIDIAQTFSAPAGWTPLYTGATGTWFKFWLGYVVRGSSAPSLTWTYTGTTPYRELYILSFSGCDPNSPIDNSVNGGATVGTAPNPPAITPASSNALALAIAGDWAGSAAGGWTPPLGYTMATNNTAGNDGMIATKQLGSNASEDPAAFANHSGAAIDIWTATVTLSTLNTVPSVSTFAATGISPTTATGNGSVDLDGGNAITERGVCWDTSPFPTTSSSKATAAGTTGSYNVSMTGLTGNTTYHMRAYATNSLGTSYGSNITFVCNYADVAWM